MNSFVRRRNQSAPRQILLRQSDASTDSRIAYVGLDSVHLINTVLIKSNLLGLAKSGERRAVSLQFPGGKSRPPREVSILLGGLKMSKRRGPKPLPLLTNFALLPWRRLKAKAEFNASFISKGYQ